MIGKLLCWIGLHSRKGWETDYSSAYVPAFGFIFRGHPDADRKRYRMFNRCRRCGNTACRFTA
jgi:hypothetical protein